MAGELTIKITGIEEVQRMLREAPKNVVARGYLKALEAGINVFRDELELRTPIRLEYDGEDLMVEGGDLKGALMTAITLDSNFRGGVAAVGYGKLGYIANMVEYGHRMVGHKPKKNVLKNSPVRPYPFMRPAFDTKADAAIDAFANALTGALQGGI